VSPKKQAAAEKELKAQVKKLRSRLEASDAKVARWKKKADRFEKAAAASQAEAKKLKKRNRRLERVSQPAETPSAAAVDEPAELPGLEVVDEPTTDLSPDLSTDLSTEPSDSGSAPDASWTVVQLRAEARSRGLTGLSGKSKAELLAALG